MNQTTHEQAVYVHDTRKINDNGTVQVPSLNTGGYIETRERLAELVSRQINLERVELSRGFRIGTATVIDGRVESVSIRDSLKAEA
jgi:hypothetical protein